MTTIPLFSIGGNQSHVSRDPHAIIDLDPRGATMCLKRRQHLQFRGLRGWTLRATGGALWITRDGDRFDTIVEPGETLRIDSNRTMLIGALADGGITLRRESAPRGADTGAAHALLRLLSRWPHSVAAAVAASVFA